MANEGLIAVQLKLEQYLFYLRNKTVVSCSQKEYTLLISSQIIHMKQA